jgi:hypothetical protein
MKPCRGFDSGSNPDQGAILFPILMVTLDP